MSHHFLKCDPKPFKALWDGFKAAEVRNNDRNFLTCDELTLEEFHDGHYSGRRIRAQVTHVQKGYGLPDHIVVLSLKVFDKVS